MITHQLLTKEEIDSLTKQIEKDQHLLFYSYLTQRKEHAQFIGQFIDHQLSAVLAYFDGLPFPAFAFYRLEQQKANVKELILYTNQIIKLEENVTGGTILNQKDLELFQAAGLIKNKPREFYHMKHVDSTKLHPSNEASLVKKEDFKEVVTFLHENGMTFFLQNELEQYPFLGMKREGQFISVGGFHFYHPQLVEIGNLIIKPDFRGKGLAKQIASQLTRLGYLISPNVYLSVFAENVPAVYLYEKIGYQKTAELSVVDFMLG